MSDRAYHHTGFVPVPNFLFDEILPTLTDTEIRVLLIVMRSTLGWHEGSDSGGTRHKERDWIAHSQMIKRTGRSSTAVSAAIQALVSFSMIVVENSNGLPLVTADERRRNMGRLYYRLGDMWKSQTKRDMGNVGTTTNNSDNIKKGTTIEIYRWSPPQRSSTGFEKVSSVLDQR